MHRFAPLVLTALLAIPIDAAQHIPGPERKVTATRPSAAGGYQWITSAVASGDHFLVVWQNRSSFYLSRTNTEPVRIDVPGVPHIANENVVVWEESGRVVSGHLIETGTVELPIVLTQLDPNEHVARVMSNESTIAVAIVDSGGDGMRVLVLDREGRLVRDSIDLGSTPAGYTGIAYGQDPGGFVVVHTWEAIRFRRITTDGIAADFSIPIGDERLDRVAVSFDGTSYLLAMDGDVTRGVLLSPAGVAQSEIFTIATEPARLNTMAGRNGGSLLFFDAPSGTRVVSFEHGTRTASAPLDVMRSQLDRVVAGEESVLALWYDFRGGEMHVSGRVLDPITGVPAPAPFVVTTGTKEELQPAIAFGRNLDLVVWEEIEPSGQRSVAAARVRHDGDVIDATTPLRVSIDGVNSVRPAVAFDGNHFVVVWCEQMNGVTEEGRVVARRVSQKGAFLDPAPIVIASQWSNRVAIAHTNGITLVTWEGRGTRRSTHGPGREIFGARFSQSGIVLDVMPLLISRDSWDHFEPDVVAADDRFLVGWQTYRWYGGHSPTYTASSVALVSIGGTVTEPVVLRAFDIGNASAPQVAWNGSEFLAAWTFRSSFAARITPEGTLGAIARVPLGRIADAAFFEGSWHLVAGVPEVWVDIPEADIRGVYLSPELEVERPVSPATSSAMETEPMLASDGTRATIVYRRALPDPPHNGSTAIVFRSYDHLPELRRRAVR